MRGERKRKRKRKKERRERREKRERKEREKREKRKKRKKGKREKRKRKRKKGKREKRKRKKSPHMSKSLLNFSGGFPRSALSSPTASMRSWKGAMDSQKAMHSCGEVRKMVMILVLLRLVMSLS